MENFKPENNLGNKSELPTHYLNRLKLLLNNFSDEIPSKVIHSPDEDNKYKVRASWWSSVSLNIYGLGKHGLIPKEYIEEYNKIMELHQKNLNENNGLTKAESIEAVNELIGKVIKHLEN